MLNNADSHKTGTKDPGDSHQSDNKLLDESQKLKLELRESKPMSQRNRAKWNRESLYQLEEKQRRAISKPTAKRIEALQRQNRKAAELKVTTTQS
jgi:hypothetical protein